MAVIQTPTKMSDTEAVVLCEVCGSVIPEREGSHFALSRKGHSFTAFLCREHVAPVVKLLRQTFPAYTGLAWWRVFEEE